MSQINYHLHGYDNKGSDPSLSNPSAPLNSHNNANNFIDFEQTTSLVELSISCRDLPNCDIVGKSDPQAFLYLLDVTGKNKKIELGRTELITNNLNPKFVKKILVKYHFEQIQRLRFEVFDIDAIGSNDFLGYSETTLADIITTRGREYTKPLVDGPTKKPGYIIINVEELNNCKQIVRFDLKVLDIPSLCCGFFRPSSSFNIYRTGESGSYTIVHRSSVTPKSSNPSFKTLDLKLLTLCNGDLDRVIKVEFIQNRFNITYPIGSFETTINSLRKGCRNNQTLMYQLSDSCSKAVITDFVLINQASFLDYIKAGAQIHFVVAIDFTASNGDPSYPDSLHYIDKMGKRPNPYESALNAVGNILKSYDTIGMFAGFGFGAKLMGPTKPPNHLFPLNGNDAHPYVASIPELLKVYRDKLESVILSGPTNFSPCIAHCSQIARQFEDGNHYFVLLIVTDGIISDMEQTKRAIIEASDGPLSIIICGVGDADFSAMNELDSDDVVMRVDGKSAKRDIVQFVPFNQYMPTRSLDPHQHGRSQTMLAEEVLREIPDQLTGYMVSKNFHPELTKTSEL